jgi:hypothetical protein
MRMPTEPDIAASVGDSPLDHLELPSTRPSLFDPLLVADPWIERCLCSDHCAVFLHNRPIAVFPVSTLDVGTLNHLLFRVRQRSALGQRI